MTDLERLDRVLRNLDAVDDAVAAISSPGKPAIRALLAESFHLAEDVMRKGARRALMRAGEGHFHRKQMDRAFWERLMALAGVPGGPGGEQTH